MRLSVLPSYHKIETIRAPRRTEKVSRLLLLRLEGVSNPLRDTADKPLRTVYKLMGDPRNVAHAKKVVQEKHHKHKDAKEGATAQPGKKGQIDKQKQPVAEENAALKTEAAKSDKQPDPTQLEKSLAVLSKLKELEFHSRGNIEKLAELSLTIEEELKQKAFAEAIGSVYSAQDVFQSKILKLIENYEAECAHLKPPG